jgi:hypothetical protein
MVRWRTNPFYHNFPLLTIFQDASRHLLPGPTSGKGPSTTKPLHSLAGSSAWVGRLLHRADTLARQARR